MSPNSAFGRRLDVSEQAHISSTLKVGQRKKLALNEFFNTTSEKYQKKVDALNIKMKREFERRRAANAAELAVLQREWSLVVHKKGLLSELLVFLNLVSVEDLMKNISNLEPVSSIIFRIFRYWYSQIENFNNATFASKIQRCAQLSALPVQASDLGSVPMRSEDYYKQNRPYWQPLDQLLNLNFDVTAKRRDLSKLQNSHNFLSGLAHEGLSELFDDIKGLEIDLSYQTEQSLRENSIFSHLLISKLWKLWLKMLNKSIFRSLDSSQVASTIVWQAATSPVPTSSISTTWNHNVPSKPATRRTSSTTSG